MKRILLIACAAAALCGDLRAQAQRPQESLSAWLYYQELAIQRDHTGLSDFLLDRNALQGTRHNHADLRLYDSAGKEIPYVLRVRRAVETTEAFTAREFNRGSEGGYAQVSYDLGAQTQPHNQVEIDTDGNNFRRLADVQGSADGVQWSNLATGAILFRFTAGGKMVEQQSIAYPVSRYRYLRIRVERDAQVDRSTPELKVVQIRRTVNIKGETASFPGSIESLDADRVNGRPATIWRVDFGARIPIERLILALGPEPVLRPFQLDAIDDPTSPTLLASGELTRRQDAPDVPLTVEFSEHYARRVKLTVTDDRNQAVSIGGFTAESPARQVLFAQDASIAGPIRVYYGNAKALAPHYDLAARLPAEPSPAPLRLSLGPRRDNPTYSPEPRPLSERVPWLVYLVLGSAAVALAAILLSLVRAGRLRSLPTAPQPHLPDSSPTH